MTSGCRSGSPEEEPVALVGVVEIASVGAYCPEGTAIAFAVAL